MYLLSGYACPEGAFSPACEAGVSGYIRPTYGLVNASRWGRFGLYRQRLDNRTRASDRLDAALDPFLAIVIFERPVFIGGSFYWEDRFHEIPAASSRDVPASG